MKMIVATDLWWGIGYKNELLYHIRADLRRFRELTLNQPIIMGRKTFDSLPAGALPSRRNIVITHDINFSAPNVEVVYSCEEAVELVDNEGWVIGGGSIYAKMLEYATTIELTRIHKVSPNIDTWFPNLDLLKGWKIDNASEIHIENGLKYQFITYNRYPH